ncbi:hypothetical protein [Pontimicrobium sp. IMCC45349]|uniref:hypothetical protein n=1 Tax=Pontimicrobium sp. IMCC45349 TaxID=3391574 RepID=UPI0039A0A08D
MKKTVFISLIIFIYSCKISKEISLQDYIKTNSITVENENFIQVKYTSESEFYSKSLYYYSIENNTDKDMFIFSTVLSESLMIYSKTNIKKSEKTEYLDSFYKDFMNDSPHSGIRKLTFNKIPPNQSLIINTKDSKYKKLKYYYYLSENENELVEIGQINLQSKIIELNRH